jgi:DNA-binding transcriptional ArsR family regulator
MTTASVLDSGRRVVTDVRALRALAHPDRLAILRLLMAGRARTATECAELVPASASACSYHLRELERFGFVEREPEAHAADGRTRWWRASAIGFSLGAPLSDDNPAGRAAFAALRRADQAENDRLARSFVERIDELPAAWQDAAEFSTYELAVSAGELRHLNAAVDDLLRPYRAGARSTTPADAAPVHIVWQAFPRTDDP